MFEELKNADAVDAKSYQDAQKKYEAIMQGFSTNEDGEASSLQDQLMSKKSRKKKQNANFYSLAAKQNFIEAQTLIKQTIMELNHCEKILSQKLKENQKKDEDYLKDKELFNSISANIDDLMCELQIVNYNKDDIDEYQNRRSNIKHEIQFLISELERQNAFRYELHFKDPDSNIDRKKVHGMVGKLFHVKNSEDSLALMMCASGDIYSYVTEDDITSKKILQKGELPRRVTFIPMNKLSTSTINPITVKFAQRLVGEENVTTALSLIHYKECYEPVMNYVFGRAFICKNLEIAKKITYHPNIMCRSVTLDGDIMDPEGTLSGGAVICGTNILTELDEIKKLDTVKLEKENELQQVEKKIQILHNLSEKYHHIKNKIDLKQVELNECSTRLSFTTFQKNQEEIQDLHVKIETMQQKINAAKQTEASSKSKIEEIEAKIEDTKGFRDQKLKLAHEKMQLTKNKSEKSKYNWKKREQEYETFLLEIEDLKKSLSSSKVCLNELNKNIVLKDKDLIELRSERNKINTQISDLKKEIQNQKDIVNSKNSELRLLLLQNQKLETHIQELELENKKKENEACKLGNDLKEMHNRVNHMEDKHAWIKEDKEFFGIKNTRYDYSKEDPTEASLKLTKMLEQKQKMERNVNTRALMLLDREEEQYSEALRRKKIVEEDKEKLKYIIKKMDEKKIEKVENAWRNVNSNFSNIFSTLLPGAQSQLQPIYQQNTLHGLKIRVGFNNVWKESLGELSGGQRSLVALSLVLAMLKFSPAPIYILDEVDAALDMSHTQNIGNMLKAHFKNSQFIIVSLKDGMFNNANVLFRTKFEEGVSSVMRTVNFKK